MTPIRLAARRPLFRCPNATAIPRRQLHSPRYRADPVLNNTTRNSAENVSFHRAEALQQAMAKRKRNMLAMGAGLSMIVPFILVQLLQPPTDQKADEKRDENWDEGKKGGRRSIMDIIDPPVKTDSPRAAAQEFQGKKVVIAPGDKIIAAPASLDHPTASDADTVELVETGTSYVPYFPKTITLPTSTGPESVESEAEYTLLGLGIRKVSFLRVQVYVVGLYVKSSSIHILQNHLINTVNPTASALIPGEKDDLRKALLDPGKSNEIWEAILSKKGTDAVEMAWRVVPVRGTDFKHLQDGWMRGIASRTDEVRRKQADLLRQQAAENKKISLPKPVDEGEFSDESFGLAMKDFKNLFQGRGKAPKGSVLLLSRDTQGVLSAMYQPIVKADKGEKMGELTGMGSVRDERVSRLVWLLYLGGQNVSSEPARQNIVDGCLALVERPVGTVETMVQ